MAITTDIIVGFPGETEQDIEDTLALLDEVQYDAIFNFKYSPRPNTPALGLGDQIPEEEKGRRHLQVQERQRMIQIQNNANYVGETCEVHGEFFNLATGQWVGKTTQHKTVNFAHPDGQAAALQGRYLNVRITRSGPVSLVGEAVVEAA
jgi:tRNA-2-methylthio-N6-dimethylallyladenosine synthase